MYGPTPEDVYYYVTLYNENYPQPVRPKGVTDEDILRGIYRFAGAPDVGRDAHPARLVGSGAILQQVLAARDLLAEKYGVAAEVYSAPSFPLLRRDALETERWNRLHLDAKTPRVPLVSRVLPFDGGPIVAASDWMKALPDMVSRWLPPHYVALGTDGFGRSDTREALRALFEIDPPHIAAATLAGARPLRRRWTRPRRRRASARSASTPTRQTRSPSRRRRRVAPQRTGQPVRINSKCSTSQATRRSGCRVARGRWMSPPVASSMSCHDRHADIVTNASTPSVAR